jgi:hypothetical protein
MGIMCLLDIQTLSHCVSSNLKESQKGHLGMIFETLLTGISCDDILKRHPRRWMHQTTRTAAFNRALNLDSPALRIYLPRKGLRPINTLTPNLSAILARRQLCDSGHVRSLCRSNAIQMQRCAICVQTLAKRDRKQGKDHVNTL